MTDRLMCGICLRPGRPAAASWCLDCAHTLGLLGPPESYYGGCIVPGCGASRPYDSIFTCFEHTQERHEFNKRCATGKYQSVFTPSGLGEWLALRASRVFRTFDEGVEEPEKVIIPEWDV